MTHHILEKLSMILLLAIAGSGPSVPSKIDLTSIDIQGNCTYVKGAPTSLGQTRVKDDGATIELTAYGTEFGHHCGQDQGRFVYVPLKGDFNVVVQIASVTNKGAKHFYNDDSTPAKAGIMAREGTDPDSRYVAIWAVSNDALDHRGDAFHFDLRKSAGAWLGNQPKECKQPHLCTVACTFVYGYVNPQVPDPDLFHRNYPNVWLRLQRKENRFYAMVSEDGKAWRATSQAFHEIEFADQLYVGLGLSAAAEGKLDQRAETVFTNVKGLH